MPHAQKFLRPSVLPWVIAALLFSSGLCALIYQMVWMREFRLIFGTSTAATAAVTGIFMGGLGAGSLLLGKRADASPSPLRLYGILELLVAATACLSPFLINLAQHLYVALGGTIALGVVPGTALRLGLAAAVIGIPAFLMGGSLPAAIKAITATSDIGRRWMAIVYGINTLGAVTGVVITTFYLFEKIGNLATLCLALVFNVLLALGSLVLARFSAPSKPASAPEEDVAEAGAPTWFVLGAAGVVGFAFFLLEMVWYRMLSPLLGGSTFTFGIILGIALLGIGLGAAVCGLTRGSRPATLHGFAISCTLEAVFVIIPFALGDRIAIFTALQQPMRLFGFGGQVLVWAVVAIVVVAPAAFIAGYQFPMLVSLLGRGKRAVGRHTGQAYAWNTGGAFLGSLAGGFGLLPLLTTMRAWQLTALLLAVLGLAAMGLALLRTPRRPAMALLPLLATAIVIALTFSDGPTAVWRHTPIGAGRVDVSQFSRRNQLQDWINFTRRGITWEADGIESTVGVSTDDGVAFMVNGKSDGNARSDGPTQVMCGLLGAILHPEPRRALVVGLGTGSSAGWLAAVPSIERVDVVELEPAIMTVAGMCAPVNRDALSNPKLRVFIGDGRELMMTTREKYDLIASEPSNPYRAGVASLFTQEFYQSAASRLNPGGTFSQWVQAYEVDSETIRTIYATMVSVFPHVETWQTQIGDLLFVASAEPIELDADRLRTRIQEEPFHSAMAKVWRINTLEGMFSHFVADSEIAETMASSPGARINTDDHTILEYAFGRTVGRNKDFDPSELSRVARSREHHRPNVIRGEVDWVASDLERVSLVTLVGEAPRMMPDFTEEEKSRANIHRAWAAEQLEEARQLWFAEPRQPANLLELSMVAQFLAYAADDKALEYIDQLRRDFPAEADAILGLLRRRQDRPVEAAAAFEAAFRGWRTDPWSLFAVMNHTLDAAVDIAQTVDDDALIAGLAEALDHPFAVSVLDERRKLVRLSLADSLTGETRPGSVARAFAEFEPNPVWNREFLSARADAYSATRNSRAPLAEADLDEFLKNDSMPNVRARSK